MNRLKELYNSKIIPSVREKYAFENIMQVPVIKKVVVNSGIGPFRDNKEAIETFVAEFSSLLGQKPHPRASKASEAGFKIRKGDIIGYAATLRGERMWAFLDKFINIALPRVRDFRGVNDQSFDENGNYTVGIKEHVIFPEVNANTTKGVRGLQITVVMDSKDVELSKFILKELGMPFKAEGN